MKEVTYIGKIDPAPKEQNRDRKKDGSDCGEQRGASLDDCEILEGGKGCGEKDKNRNQPAHHFHADTSVKEICKKPERNDDENGCGNL